MYYIYISHTYVAFYIKEIHLKDLQRPLSFRLFQLLGRLTFACYSDAQGVMTLEEFRCAVHKMAGHLG